MKGDAHLPSVLPRDRVLLRHLKENREKVDATILRSEATTSTNHVHSRDTVRVSCYLGDVHVPLFGHRAYYGISSQRGSQGLGVTRSITLLHHLKTVVDESGPKDERRWIKVVGGELKGIRLARTNVEGVVLSTSTARDRYIVSIHRVSIRLPGGPDTLLRQFRGSKQGSTSARIHITDRRLEAG